MTFPDWAREIHAYLKRYVPDAQAKGSSKSVRFTRSTLTVRLQPDGNVWWVHFERAGAFAMPPLSVDQHTPKTARAVAKTIMGFFDDALSTPHNPTIS